ncbi:MAG: TonB-dependent receptor [Deltaproteobacteria bacterium]|nr:TonB-dependent receptor [Deltaproteobacteria bacterium]
MMKLKWLTVCLGVMCLAAPPLNAGGIINKPNQSTEWIRTLNRNAATDYADIAVFNPAGIAKMPEDGLYVKLDAMYFDKDYSNTVPVFGKLDQDEPTICPAFFTVYKKKRWGGFFAFTIPAGGGELDFKDGSARTVAVGLQLAPVYDFVLGGTYVPTDQKMNVKKSNVYGFTLGGTYAITDWVSVAAGARYSIGKREFDASVTLTDISGAGAAPSVPLKLKIDQDADGWAGILGVNFSVLDDRLNTALTFISNTKLNYKNDVNRDTVVPGMGNLSDLIGKSDGSKTRIDIPALLGFGISYRFLPQLKVDLNYTRYFEKNATIDTFEGEGNSWELGLSAEYRFSPKWMVSVGGLHTDIKLAKDEQINEPEEPKLDSNALSAGLVYNPLERLTLTFGGLKVWYDSVTDSNGIKYDKDIWSLALGAQYRF